jgi:type II secretory pathway pseudopilin PulG
MRVIPKQPSLKFFCAAFTLVEVMMASSVMMVILAGLITSHIFGLRMFQIANAKITADTDARKAISQMTDEIRGAKWLEVGNWDANNKIFTEAVEGQPQQGNALQIYSTQTNTPYVRYYKDVASSELKRITSSNAKPQVIAHSVSNNVVFTSENMLGQVIKTNENNRVIGLNLQFYQIEYPIIKIGPGQHYDYYQVNTKITRRTLE